MFPFTAYFYFYLLQIRLLTLSPVIAHFAPSRVVLCGGQDPTRAGAAIFGIEAGLQWWERFQYSSREARNKADRAQDGDSRDTK